MSYRTEMIHDPCTLAPPPFQAYSTLTPKLAFRGFDRHSIRIAVLLALITALNLFDLAYTLFAQHQGVLNELNPIASNLFNMDLEPSVICFKALTLLVGISLLWKLRHSPWTLWACWLLIGVYSSLGIRWFMWSNNYTQYMELEPTLRVVYHAAKTI
ncbi:MAG: DUF5658 family protein [Phycisphaerae bacterium]